MIEERDNSEWTNAIIDIAIYALIMVVSLIAVAMIGIPRLQTLFSEIPASSSRNVDQYADLVRSLSNITVPGVIMLMVLVGLLSTVTAVIQNALIHVAASRMLKGNGTLVAMLGKIVPFQSVILLITFVLLIAILLLLPLDSSSSGAFETAALIWLLLSLAILIVSIWASIKMARLLGEVYQFGAGNGCAALLIGSVLYSIVNYACSCILPVFFSAFFGRTFS